MRHITTLMKTISNLPMPVGNSINVYFIVMFLHYFLFAILAAVFVGILGHIERLLITFLLTKIYVSLFLLADLPEVFQQLVLANLPEIINIRKI